MERRGGGEGAQPMRDKEEMRRGKRVCTGNQVRSRRRRRRRWAGLVAANKLLQRRLQTSSEEALISHAA